MMKSRLHIWQGTCLIFFIGFACRALGQQDTSPASANPTNLTKSAGSEAEHVLDKSKLPKSSWPSDGCSQRVIDSVVYSLEQSKADPPIGSKPTSGMISEQEAIDVALKSAGQYCRTNIPPTALLVDDLYIVTCWKAPRPFEKNPITPVRQIGVDAWNGGYLGNITYNVEGIKVPGVVRKTGAYPDISRERSEPYFERFCDIVSTLEDEMKRVGGLLPEAKALPGMITPEAAIELAKQQVADKKYDHSREPYIVLVGDAYIVVFWRKEDEVLPGGWLYYARVAIDAKTGEFIALDVYTY